MGDRKAEEVIPDVSDIFEKTVEDSIIRLRERLVQQDYILVFEQCAQQSFLLLLAVGYLSTTFEQMTKGVVLLRERPFYKHVHEGRSGCRFQI